MHSQNSDETIILRQRKKKGIKSGCKEKHGHRCHLIQAIAYIWRVRGLPMEIISNGVSDVKHWSRSRAGFYLTSVHFLALPWTVHMSYVLFCMYVILYNKTYKN